MGDNAIDVPPLQLLGEHVPPSTPWIAAHAPDREGVVLNQCVLNPDPPILPQWYAGNQKGLTFLNIYCIDLSIQIGQSIYRSII